MRKRIAGFLVYIHNHIRRSHTVRKLLKKTLGQDKILVRFNDLNMMVSTVSAIESNILFNEYNEMEILAMIKKFTKSGYNFIDIGANIGLHSLTAASSNPDIEVYSFEPETHNYQNFLKNIVLNEFLNIRPFKMGLGNIPGNVTMNINDGWNKGRHSIKVSFEGARKVQIPISTLDSFKDNLKNNHLLVKIDVEGFEKEVIEGAKQILRQAENIVIIIELLSEINGYDNCLATSQSLRKLGFKHIYKITTDNGFIAAADFDGSADYIYIKGDDALMKFNTALSK